jgi:hypothetical protein
MLAGTSKRLVLCAGLAGVLALSVASSASALTLGAVAPPNMGGCSNCNVMGFQSAVGAPKYRVPAGPTGFWTITAWSSQGGGADAGQARLRVYRQSGSPGQYKMVRQSALETIPAHGHPSNATSLNVMKGDLLGLSTVDNVVSAYDTGVTGDNTKTILCNLTGPGQIVGPGTSCPFGNLGTELPNVSVTLQSR